MNVKKYIREHKVLFKLSWLGINQFLPTSSSVLIGHKKTFFVVNVFIDLFV